MANLITRRGLGLAAAAGAAALKSHAAEVKSYAGALPEDMPGFDPVAWTLERYRSAPLRLSFSRVQPQDPFAWQRELRAKVTELLGGFPARTPLKPRTLETKMFPAYRREKVIFESRPGLGVLAYLLTPSSGAPPWPAVVCVPGHGRGVDDIVGIGQDGRERTDKSGYQHDFALQAVEHGLAAVAIEPMAFGCRRNAVTKAKGQGASACQPAAGAALLLGETMIGWRVYDVMRTVDWMETRPEIDPKRIGCMGISGGGTCTLFSTALDQRIRVAMLSGYLNTFRDSIMSLSHCIDNYIPGILNWAEMYDVAGLIAPRPLFAESGDRDPIFPIQASRESFARVKAIYAAFPQSGPVEQEIFPGDHHFHGERGLPFLERALRL